MSKQCPKCQYLVGAPLLSSTAFILLAMEFTRAAQVVAGILHNDITELLDVRYMVLHLPLEDAPHVLNRVQAWRHSWPLNHLQLHRQGSCHLGSVFWVVVMLENSSSASECHSTCWNPCFPQWTASLQYQQLSCSPRLWCYQHHAWL